MKNLKSFGLILLLVNVFLIQAQNENSNDTAENIKKSVTQNLYIFLNEKFENPLLLINNFIWGNDTTVLSIINPNDIKDIIILKDKDSIELYGESGKNGILGIKLKDTSINTLEKFKTIYGLHSSNSKVQNISGIISNSEKNPISNIVISNLNRKESFKSDSNGKYSLTARENDILLFYRNGFKSKIIKVKDPRIDVILDSNSDISIK